MGAKEDLLNIVGLDGVFDDPSVLEEYSQDFSFVPPTRPQ